MIYVSSSCRFMYSLTNGDVFVVGCSSLKCCILYLLANSFYFVNDICFIVLPLHVFFGKWGCIRSRLRFFEVLYLVSFGKLILFRSEETKFRAKRGNLM